MYQYNEFDAQLLQERVAQFRDQTRRYLAGELTEDQFRPLRLMNGLYIQTHAPMLRVNIPYGQLSSRQLRQLAYISRTYDKNYGHISTRQNIQFNWPKLESVPDILADLAEVEMHAIQSSGNCIRNITSDYLAGISSDEIEDPRPYCEIIRQWSTLHPEFAFLPRKFKIAISGSPKDRAVTQVHDIGLHMVRNAKGEVGFEVLVGGGLGRTPVIGQTIHEFMPKADILSYLEAILRVYNRYGRRDNKYKARIKILVREIGLQTMSEMVDAEWQIIKDSTLRLDEAEIQRVAAFFESPDYQTDIDDRLLMSELDSNSAFNTWYQYNTEDHKQQGYRVVKVSLKAPMQAPGDITDQQMDILADLADKYSFGLLRTTHDQNMVLTDVKRSDLLAVWQVLHEHNMATANIGTLTDMICCPGLDFCSLANASSLSIAKQINERFDDLDYLHDLGPIQLKMSGCMNGCGHHSIGEIGILGVDKKGEEWYQLTLGGRASHDSALGERLGPSIAKAKVADAIEDIIKVYTEHRQEHEIFIETVQRIGIQPFKDQVYATH